MDNYESFISLDLDKFIGEWVAIDNNKIIAHGKNLSVVYNEARKSIKIPFITKIRTSTIKLL